MFSKPSGMTSSFLTLSIVLFVTLDLAMLALNFKITQEVSEDALIINLTGRQRMLSQRMGKLMFQVKNDDLYSDNSSLLITQFVDVFDLFTNTLQGFQHGGVVSDAELRLVEINRINSREGQRLITEALAMTSAMKETVAQLRQDRIEQDVLTELKGNLVAHSDVLLDMMNELTVITEKISQAQTQRLRIIQLVTFLLAMFNFLVIIRSFRSVNQKSAEMAHTLNDLLQATQASIIIFDEDRKVLMSNSKACELFGYDASVMEGRYFKDLFLDIDGHLAALSTHHSLEDPIYIELHERVIHQAGKKMIVATALDITHHFKHVKILSKLANHDPLTGLLNRAAMQVGIKEKIDDAVRYNQRFACFFIDLNNFKQINDNYGHDAGDRVLVEFAARLKSSIRTVDRFYRYGGDEFILIVDLINGDCAIDKVTDKIGDSIKQPITLSDGNRVELSVSTGITIYPDDAKTQQELLSEADKRMYSAKKSNNFNISPGSKKGS